MSRERKQQLRHQNRTQQKAAELATVAAEASASEKAPAAQTKQSQKAAKKAEALREAEKVQQESIASTAAAADVAAAAAAEPSLPSKRSAGPKVKPESAATEAVPLQPVEDAETAAMPVAEAAKVDLPPAAPEEIGPSVLAEDANASGARPAVSYANGALSFQTITDSLFAQLNAKVSTPATNSAMPTFAGTQALGGHAGIRAPGFPISGVDPLLFSTSATNDPAASGRLGGPFDAPSQFSLFGSQAPTQWGEPGPANGPYTQTPLSSLLADSNPLGPPIGVSREMSVGSGSGSSSRQRSRWDFAHVDEASAQAELQSVLGRSAGPPIGALGQQPVHGPAATSFASSRDLGMFSTPVRGGGGYMSNGPWGSIPPQQQHHQHQQGVAPAPFPPPGFGSKQSSGTLHTESSPMAAFGPGVHGGNQSIAPGSSALLSKLMGQQHQMPALGDDGVMLHNAGFPPHQQMQQHQMQDPAIMMSQMVPTGTGTPGSSGSDQQRGRADPNVLNSLLARLHLSRGDSDPAFQRTPSGDQLAYSHTIAGSQQVSGMLPPGMMPAGAVVSPVYSGHPQHSPLSTLQAQLSAGSSGSGFVDPAIMNIGRLNVRGNSTAASSTGPSSPIGLPPGIASPGIKSPVSGDNSALAAPGQTRMLPRSANSSGRSRFLNHFSAETDNQKQQPPPISEAAAAAAAEPSNTGRSGTSSVAEHEEGGATMVNGVPPGLPTTGLFGELLRRAKQDSLSSSAAATVPSASAPSYGGGDSSAFISGKMMLGDIERKLEAARREAQELQAQLSTVIGQNQTAMRVLANGSTPAASAAGDPAASATM
ncbi:hypothetical protein GGF43_004366 [Coemansia sp. RSA 2618]|nr:hypothetical protein GGF43_004366 [Coemansia sp. RSA 2618]